jgi:hypothetical protein
MRTHTNKYNLDSIKVLKKRNDPYPGRLNVRFRAGLDPTHDLVLGAETEMCPDAVFISFFLLCVVRYWCLLPTLFINLSVWEWGWVRYILVRVPVCNV